MVQPPTNHTYQQKVLEAPFQCLFYRKSCIGIVLLTRKYNGFNVQMGVFIGIKVAHDQIRGDTQPLLMLQTTVAADKEVILP